MPFVFFILPKSHYDSLKNFVVTNCLLLLIFRVRFSKAAPSNSAKDRGSAVALVKSSLWISMSADWVLGCSHSEWENWCLCGGIDRGEHMELGAEHQEMLRRGAGLQLLPLSDLGTSLLFKTISPKSFLGFTQQKMLNDSFGMK